MRSSAAALLLAGVAVAAPAPVAPACGTEMFQNGAFTSAVSPWTVSFDGPATGKIQSAVTETWPVANSGSNYGLNFKLAKGQSATATLQQSVVPKAWSYYDMKFDLRPEGSSAVACNASYWVGQLAPFPTSNTIPIAAYRPTGMFLTSTNNLPSNLAGDGQNTAGLKISCTASDAAGELNLYLDNASLKEAYC